MYDIIYYEDEIHFPYSLIEECNDYSSWGNKIEKYWLYSILSTIKVHNRIVVVMPSTKSIYNYFNANKKIFPLVKSVVGRTKINDVNLYIDFIFCFVKNSFQFQQLNNIFNSICIDTGYHILPIFKGSESFCTYEVQHDGDGIITEYDSIADCIQIQLKLFPAPFEFIGCRSK